MQLTVTVTASLISISISISISAVYVLAVAMSPSDGGRVCLPSRAGQVRLSAMCLLPAFLLRQRQHSMMVPSIHPSITVHPPLRARAAPFPFDFGSSRSDPDPDPERFIPLSLRHPSSMCDAGQDVVWTPSAAGTVAPPCLLPRSTVCLTVLAGVALLL
ncbi:hypothetical protein BS78_10G006400 [Paspalum vaginatum]|nr:hypothetical protein BS78_10G006400 [Paspalum vaginatum]